MDVTHVQMLRSAAVSNHRCVYTVCITHPLERHLIGFAGMAESLSASLNPLINDWLLIKKNLLSVSFCE